MIKSAFVALLSVAFSAAASPVATAHDRSLFLTKNLNASRIYNLALHDQQRAKFLKSRIPGQEGLGLRTNEPLVNQGVDYTATILIGDPPRSYSVVVDTGSSNTWVGADLSHPYVVTKTSSVTLDAVSVSYGSGSFTGLEYTDTVSLAPGLTITKQSIGAAATSSGFDGVDGILGLGPVDLTEGTLIPGVTATIPTVTDNLFSQGKISTNSLAISFEPTMSATATEMNGVITWGAVDASKFTGSIIYSPVTAKSPANEYWGVDMSATYGASRSSIFSTTAGIVDTGTTLILIPSDAFKIYQATTGGVSDSTTGLIKFTLAQFSALESMFVSFGGATFELTANAQIWPRSLNTAIGGVTSAVYGIVSDIGDVSGSGLDFIMGYAFLERFYSVYDSGNKRVGLATTPFTTATTN